MSNNNHMMTEDFKRYSRELGRKGHKYPGQEALKRMGVEKAVKRKYHDDYLDEQASKD